MSNDTAQTIPAVTRYAPSPTGYPHIGNLRTAIFSFLQARKTGGKFILRIEDTDQKRLVPGSLEAIKDSLKWLGIEYDEGPDIGGPNAPYVQSERLPIFQKYAKKLVDEGKAYYCYCTPERLEAVNKAKQAQKLPSGYDRRCRNISQVEIDEAIAQGVKPVVRFKIPLDGKTGFNDFVRGEITFDNATLQDAVILKSDGFPTYHLAYMVDDYLMGVTHVVRGQEWTPSVPLHILLYNALGFPIPVLVHTPLILNPPPYKGKLSKRDNAVSVAQYRELGYLPEALLNYLVLLGWSYDDHTEIFSMQDLIEKFDLHRIQPTPAKFSPEKLEWMNAYYINHILTEAEFVKRTIPFLIEAGVINRVDVEDPEKYRLIYKAVRLTKDKVKTLLEVAPEIDFAFKSAEDLDYPAEDLIGKKNAGADEVVKILQATIRKLQVLADAQFNHDDIYTALEDVRVELGIERSPMFWSPRVAIAGKKQSPGLPELIVLFGRDESIHRLSHALKKIASNKATKGN
jgi:glutamyl-tRNA synthetase